MIWAGRIHVGDRRSRALAKVLSSCAPMPHAPSYTWIGERLSDLIDSGVQPVAETKPDIDARHIRTRAPGTCVLRDLAGLDIVGSRLDCNGS